MFEYNVYRRRKHRISGSKRSFYVVQDPHEVSVELIATREVSQCGSITFRMHDKAQRHHGIISTRIETSASRHHRDAIRVGIVDRVGTASEHNDSQARLDCIIIEGQHFGSYRSSKRPIHSHKQCHHLRDELGRWDACLQGQGRQRCIR